MIYDLIVVGGGAAGMMAAITAAQSGKKVMILEKMDRLGKKILATGNGRCNFTNSFCDETCYRSSQNHFPYLALEQFDHHDTIAFFEKAGIAVIEKNGYYYPRSNQASAIANGLIYEVERLKIDVVLKCQVDRAFKKSDHFMVLSGNRKFCSYHLLLAAGGKAQEKLGSDGSGFVLAKKFGHTIVEPFPALTALELKSSYLKEAAGVRTFCKVLGRRNGKTVATEEGELQITKYGVSGVLIFQISRYLIEGMKNGEPCEVRIDFLPEITDKTIFFEKMKQSGSLKTIRQGLEGYFPPKLSDALLHLANIRADQLVVRLSNEEQKSLFRWMKNAVFSVTGWKGFHFAQVTAGGVQVKEVSPYTMESEIVPGLYFAGEILDVDGTCGGYNLQWAWTSGYLAGRSIL